MAIFTAGEMNALNVMVEKSVIRSFKNVDPKLNWGNDFLRKVQVNSEEQIYAWIQDWAKLTERLNFYSDTKRKDLKVQYMTVKPKHWSDAIQIPSLEATLDEVKLDYLGKAKDIGAYIGQHPTEMLLAYLADGTTNLTWDGKYYFDDDHPVGDGTSTYDNLLAGDISQTTLIAATVAMARFVDVLGDPMGLIPNKLIISKNDEYKARVLLNSTYIPSSSTGNVNPVQNIIQDMIVEARSLSTGDSNYDDWIVACTNWREKPFLHVGLKGYDTPNITNNLSLVNTSFWNKIYEWKVEISHNVAPTFPFLAIKTVGA